MKRRTDYGEQLCGPDGFADTTTAHRAGRRLRLNSDRALIGSEEPRSDSYILDVDSQQQALHSRGSTFGCCAIESLSHYTPPPTGPRLSRDYVLARPPRLRFGRASKSSDMNMLLLYSTLTL